MIEIGKRFAHFTVVKKLGEGRHRRSASLTRPEEDTRTLQ